MLIKVMISNEAAEYYKAYDLDQIVAKMLETVDYEELPKTTRPQVKQRSIIITNRRYLELRQMHGATSKKVSISRLLEFGVDTLWLDTLKAFGFDLTTIEKVVSNKENAITCLSRAYTSLSDAIQLLPEDINLPECRQIVGMIKRRLEDEKTAESKN